MVRIFYTKATFGCKFLSVDISRSILQYRFEIVTWYLVCDRDCTRRKKNQVQNFKFSCCKFLNKSIDLHFYLKREC